jgi:hypothetical protein
MQQKVPDNGKKRRKNVSLTPANIATINAIRASTDASTATDVVKRALKVYELIVQKGARVSYKDEDGKETSVVVV